MHRNFVPKDEKIHHLKLLKLLEMYPCMIHNSYNLLKILIMHHSIIKIRRLSRYQYDYKCIKMQFMSKDSIFNMFNATYHKIFTSCYKNMNYIRKYINSFFNNKEFLINLHN